MTEPEPIEGVGEALLVPEGLEEKMLIIPAEAEADREEDWVMVWPEEAVLEADREELGVKPPISEDAEADREGDSVMV